MSDPFAHLLGETEKEPVGDNVLRQVADLAAEWKVRKARVEALEAALKEAKLEFNKVSQEALPNILLTNGLGKVNLATGESITIKEEVSASVKHMGRFYEFLLERGDGSLVKTDLSFGKIPPEILDKIQTYLADTYDLYPEMKQVIHPQTLQKYIRDLCGIGGNTEASIPVSALDENMITVFTYYKTTVK